MAKNRDDVAERDEVYLDTLLERWSRARQQGIVVGKALDTLETIAILGPLALWLQTASPAGTAQYHELLREATTILARRGAPQPERDARDWLMGLREHSGLLVERGVDAGDFCTSPFRSTWPPGDSSVCQRRSAGRASGRICMIPAGMRSST
ncbi:MAG TPA: hypothetical protein VD886_18400 [Herpetosiphonaceae bacterium]|nr:hypothetical protein [Herpetosiphonaceae bacterium]